MSSILEMSADDKADLQDLITERWEAICAFDCIEGAVEFDVRGHDVVLRTEDGMERCSSYDNALGFLNGIEHAKGW